MWHVCVCVWYVYMCAGIGMCGVYVCGICVGMWVCEKGDYTVLTEAPSREGSNNGKGGRWTLPFTLFPYYFHF